MPRDTSLLKAPDYLLLVMLFIGLAPVAGHPFAPPPLTGQRIDLASYFTVFQDSTGLIPADELYRRPSAFIPLSKASSGNPVSYYWLRTTLHADSTLDPGEVLSFDNLTYVDVYLYSDSGLILQGAYNEPHGGRPSTGDHRESVATMLPLLVTSAVTLPSLSCM